MTTQVIKITTVSMTNTASRSESACSRVRQAREKKGIGSRELDRLAGLKEGHVAVIEGRDGALESETALKIAKALGVSLEWLISGNEDHNGFAEGAS